MTVMHVHPDSASLDYHMDVAGPRFGRFADFLTLSSNYIFGDLIASRRNHSPRPAPKAITRG
jgi:hypothetical protein